jgi:hypothetical protein
LSHPNRPSNPEVGFPTLSWEEEDLTTRPMPLHERPLQARVDVEMALIAQYHVRIALAIESFWGHRDCVDYLQPGTQRLQGRSQAHGLQARGGECLDDAGGVAPAAVWHLGQALVRPAPLRFGYAAAFTFKREACSSGSV